MHLFKRGVSALILGCIAVFQINATQWDSDSNNIFDLGFRIGFNTSNQTRSGDNMLLNLDSWGTGFNAGVIADIKITNAWAIQPGVFFESRSNNYSYIHILHSEYGHTRYTNFTIPVLASYKLHLNSNTHLSFDLGPYFQFGVGGSDKGTSINGNINYEDGYYDKRNKFDIGIKIGGGLHFLSNMYAGVHYEAGLRDVWKKEYADGGRRKSWVFTIGYDF